MKNKMGAKFLTLLLISVGLTIVGYWLDSDLGVSLSTTLVEFIMMTILTLLIVSGFYFVMTYTLKKAKKVVFKS